MRIANDFVLPPGISGERLINEGKSRPGNPKIANTFFRAGFIESWGRGIKEIRSICKNYGTKEPLFEVDQDCVFVTFYPLEESVVEESKSSEKNKKSEEKSREKIIQLMKENPNITMEQLADNLELSIKAIEKHIKNLKNEKVISRIGPDKGGLWEVTITEAN